MDAYLARFDRRLEEELEFDVDELSGPAALGACVRSSFRRMGPGLP